MSDADPAAERTLAGLSAGFWIFWGGQAISTLGSSFTGFAMPLLIYKLTGSALNLSLSMAVSYVPYLALGLLIGAWVDRLDRKRLMIVANLLLAASVGSVPLAAGLGHLSVGWIYGVQLVNATLRLFFSSAAFAAIPSLVSKDQIVAANGRIQASYSAMSVVGPLLAGGLAAVVSLPSLLLVDALSYLVSAGALILVRRGFNLGDEVRPPQTMRHDIVEGLTFLLRHPVLRNISLMMALVNFFSMTVAAQLVFFAKVQLHASNAQVGLLFSANAVGVFLLALVAGPLRRHWPFSRLALALLEIQGFVTLVIAQLHVFWAVLPLIALWQGLGTLFTINTTSLRQILTPNYLLGRVATTAGVFGGATIPLGTLLGGLAITRTGNIALVFSVVGVMVFLLPIVFSFTALGHAERYLPRQQGEAVARSDALGRWIESTVQGSRAGSGADGRPDADDLDDEDIVALRGALDGIDQAAQDISRLLAAPNAGPAVPGLSEVLANLGAQMEDINYHWNDIVHRLEKRKVSLPSASPEAGREETRPRRP